MLGIHRGEVCAWACLGPGPFGPGHRTVSYCIISYCIVSYCIVSYRTVWYSIVPSVTLPRSQATARLLGPGPRAGPLGSGPPRALALGRGPALGPDPSGWAMAWELCGRGIYVAPIFAADFPPRVGWYGPCLRSPLQAPPPSGLGWYGRCWLADHAGWQR